MKKKIHVLVFPAGEVNSAELHSALSTCVNVKVFGASSIDRHGPYLFRHYSNNLPMMSDDSFISELNNLISEWDIDIIIPTHDSVVNYLTSNRSEIRARILGPSSETAAICRSKRKTYGLFADESFCPKLYQEDDTLEFPVFCKPEEGQGSIGAKIIRHDEELRSSVNWISDVVTEYLPGSELTIDCFTDRHGELLGVFPRIRNRVMAGISVAGQTMDPDSELLYIAETINKQLDLLGLWFFQVKKSKDDQWKLLEIAARCSCSQCLTRARGINLPLLSVYACMGRDVELFENPYTVSMDRTLLSRYEIDYRFNTVYIDYDDTIIIEDQVNVDMIRLLYQLRNEGKRLLLITRHDGPLEEHMDQMCIPENLFDKIIHISEEDEKHSFVEPHQAIFIDNAFIERKKIRDVHGIPVFDVDTAEVLHKWHR